MNQFIQLWFIKHLNVEASDPIVHGKGEHGVTLNMEFRFATTIADFSDSNDDEDNRKAGCRKTACPV